MKSFLAITALLISVQSQASSKEIECPQSVDKTIAAVNANSYYDLSTPSVTITAQLYLDDLDVRKCIISKEGIEVRRYTENGKPRVMGNLKYDNGRMEMISTVVITKSKVFLDFKDKAMPDAYVDLNKNNLLVFENGESFKTY